MYDDYGEDGPPVYYAPETNLSYVNTVLAALTGYTLVIRFARNQYGELYAYQAVTKLEPIGKK